MTTDNDDACIVDLKIKDAKGNLCHLTKNKVTFKVTGNAKFSGLDNGDMVNHYNYKGDNVKKMTGRFDLMVQANSKAGYISIKAVSDGLVMK